MRFIYACLVLMTVVLASAAAEAVTPADYAGRFEVDMKEDIPPLEELRRMFAPNRFMTANLIIFGISAKYSTRGLLRQSAVTEPAKPG